MNPLCTGPLRIDALNRRQFLSSFGLGLGGIALGSILNPSRALSEVANGGTLGAPHFRARAKRIIYLFMAGGPSQLESFDYKPLLNERQGQELPDSVRMGQRLTGMTGNQASLPMAGSIFKFNQHGKSGAWVSEILPHTAKVVDDLCIVRSMYTEAINHDPAFTFMQTGSQISGRPSMGAWLSYGLGTENQNLPSFVVLITPGKVDQPLSARLWGSGFLPSRYQGVQFRSGKDPVLYLSNPDGLSDESRRLQLASLRQLHEIEQEKLGDAEINTRIGQYEMAFRMQTSVPDVVNVSGEPDHVFDLYGPDARKPGTFASNCLLARRLAERGVKFIQLYHQGWDHHGNVPGGMRTQCRETDQPAAALIQDLKQRGMLDDTLVIWGGEFGRTPYAENKEKAKVGRDHHHTGFSMLLAGGGVKRGYAFGGTDEFGMKAVDNPVHVHDLHATILHLMGLDHEKLTYRYSGRDFRLTDVYGRVVKEVLA